MAHLTQILLLLAVALVLACQPLQVPSALVYLLAGVILGAHTAGPAVQVPELTALAEFGVVFLLFTSTTRARRSGPSRCCAALARRCRSSRRCATSTTARR